MSDEPSFEQALAELQSVVAQLQQPDVPLERAVALYRRGTELAERTEELLAGAELQVQQLTDAVRERFASYTIEPEWEREE